jgi:hypothetical protein
MLISNNNNTTTIPAMTSIRATLVFSAYSFHGLTPISTDSARESDSCTIHKPIAGSSTVTFLLFLVLLGVFSSGNVRVDINADASRTLQPLWNSRGNILEETRFDDSVGSVAERSLKQIHRGCFDAA